MGVWLMLLFIILVLLVLVIDYFVFAREARSDIRRTKEYIKNNANVDVSIYLGDYFCYLYDTKEYKITETLDVFEVCICEGPNFLSFKNRKTRETEIIYLRELGEVEYYNFVSLFKKFFGREFMYDNTNS